MILLLQALPADSPSTMLTLLELLAIGGALSLIIQGILGYLFMTLLDRAAPRFRTVNPPEKSFLLLVPFFNLYYNFVLFQGVPDTYRAQFEAAGRPREGDYGRGMGMWIAVCVVLGMAGSIMPCVGFVPGLAALVLLFPYFSRLFALSRELPPVDEPEPPAEDFAA